MGRPRQCNALRSCRGLVIDSGPGSLPCRERPGFQALQRIGSVSILSYSVRSISASLFFRYVQLGGGQSKINWLEIA